MSTEAQKLGTILIVDDEVSFYKEIAIELFKEYKVVTFINKKEVLTYDEIPDLKLAIVDLNLDRSNDGFGVIEYLKKVYPRLPILVGTKDNSGPTARDALRNYAVEDVLFKINYDKVDWLNNIQKTLLKYSKKSTTAIYLTYHPSDEGLAKVILKTLNKTKRCSIIDGGVANPTEKDTDLILALISKNVLDENQNRVRNVINWGGDIKKNIKGMWIDVVSRNRVKNIAKTPQSCTGNNMVADLSKCLKQVDNNKISWLESLLNPEQKFSEHTTITKAFNDEIDKILKAYQL